MKYHHIYCDDSGASRLEDGAFQFSTQMYAPPAPPVEVSDSLAASKFMIVRIPKNWADHAHPAPAREYVFVLEGAFQLEASGESRLVSAGDVVFVDDLGGPGHSTTILEDLVVAVVRL